MYRVRSSIDNENQAVLIAKELVQSHAAVSVHIRTIRSVYQWKEQVYDEQEWELESITSCPDEIERIIKGMHPYECPEILIDIIQTSDKITEWITGWCKYNKDSEV